MQIGSPEHKAQFLQDLSKTYQENVWKEEIQLLEFEQLLGQFRTKKAEADLKLERKEFPTAGEGKKVIAKLDSDIESTQAAIDQKKSAVSV